MTEGKSMKPEHIFTSCTKINSKWLKDLNINTIKLLEENLGKTFSHINHTNVLLGQSPKAMEIKTKITQWDIIKGTSFCISKNDKKTKRQPKEGEKRVANDATMITAALFTIAKTWKYPKTMNELRRCGTYTQ